jgi:hypothetical protein
MAWDCLIAVFIGCLLANLIKLNKAWKVSDFSWGRFLKENGIPAIVNLIIGVACVWKEEALSSIYPITFVSSIVLGAAGQFVFKGVVDSVSPGVSTAIGLND